MIIANSKETLGPRSSRYSKYALSQTRRKGEIAQYPRKNYDYFINSTSMFYLGT